MSATVWLVLTATGFGLLRALPMVGHDLLKSILVRVAAFAFIGAGVIGASGWIGSWFQAAMGWINTQGAGGDARRDRHGGRLGAVARAVDHLAARSPPARLVRVPHARLAVRHRPGAAGPRGEHPRPVGDFFQTVNQDIGNLMIHAASSAIGAA
jgi:hypothetical protein